MVDPHIRKMAQVILRYSTALKTGETVFVRGLSPAAEPLMQMLYQEALRMGARPYTYMHMNMEDALAIEATDDTHLLSQPNPMLLQMYAQADVVIGIHATHNLNALSRYSAAKQAARTRANAAPLRLQRDRAAARKVRRCTTLFPTHAYAQSAGMSLLQYSSFVYHACKLHHDDPVQAWLNLRDQQQEIVDFLAGRSRIDIRGVNIELSMSIVGRSFINSAGTANFPDGEIFTSPVEDSVNGWVRFSHPATYEGVRIDGIELRFENGRVVGATAQENEAYLYQIMEVDSGARVVGEFAIGTNTDIQQFTGLSLFDEKIAGTIHLALGQGFKEAGGRNRSEIHWDLVYDMGYDGEILVDGQLFYKGGKFYMD